MIPKEINSAHIRQALNEISISGVPIKRKSTKYDLHYNNEKFPPKYVISIANKFVNGKELSSTCFDAPTAKKFLENLGFEILKK